MNRNVPEEITCLFSKVSEHNAMLGHRRLGHENVKNLNRLSKTTIEKCVACALGKHHRKPHKPKVFNSISSVFQLLHMDLFGLNRVLINKSQMKSPYEIIYGHKPTVAHFHAFGCPCTLLNLDSTPKFGAKADDCYFMGYVGHTTYRVYNKSTKQIVESYDIRWLEENETDARVGPNWLFDYNELFKSFNVPSTVDPKTSDIVGCADEDEELFDILQKGSVADPDPTLVSESTPSSPIENGLPSTSTPSANVPLVEVESLIRQVFGSTLFPYAIPNKYIASTSYQHSTAASGWRNPLIDSLDELTNLPATSIVLDHSVPSRIQRDHPIKNIIGPFESGVSTRSQTGNINNCLYFCCISQIEPKSVDMALHEPSWVDAMHEELNQFDKLNVWKLVELPSGKNSLDTRWVFRNKQDDTGVIVRNKARLVVRGFRQVEGLDYTEVYAPVARLEAIVYYWHMHPIWDLLSIKWMSRPPFCAGK
ncbi:uncharacterized protein LOC143571083 [Bidens hawaiensis]|uniref:uncharacterized protein LOC143571083 n=1 Tax=Bidens hawaiensis TaxID=980011 RepID=UPI00404A0133